MRHEIQRADKVHATLEVITAGTGVSGLSPTAIIRRLSDNQYWNGAAWQAGYVTVAMTEVDSANLPGLYAYELGVVTEAIGAPGFYVMMQESTYNLVEYLRIDTVRPSPWDEVRASYATVGSFGEALQTPVESSLTVADAVWDEPLAGHVTAGTAGVALSTAGTAPTAASIADAVWDEVIAGHLTAGSTGETLSNSASVTAAAIADAVWDETAGDHVIAGSTGEALGNAGGSASAADIADAVWDEARADHAAAGSFGLLLQVIGGMVQYNHRLKNPTYDPNGRMLTATMVTYPTGTDADNDTNALSTVAVEMTYDALGNLQSLKAKE